MCNATSQVSIQTFLHLLTTNNGKVVTVVNHIKSRMRTWLQFAVNVFVLKVYH